jgi:hypothetical protein
MPGLLRGVARTAVVAGTASAVSGRVHRRQQNKWAQQDTRSVNYDSYAQPSPAYTAPPRSGTDTNTKLAQLRELAQLRDSGVLDEAEFELQKSQILNS